MEDIKTAFREERYDAIPILLDGARKSLISAIESRPTMSEQNRDQIEQMLKFFTELEITVSKQKREQLASKSVKIVKALVEHSNAFTALLASTETGA